MTKIFCVLREGGEYNQYHVDLLKKQIPEIKVLPLKYNWPGWWSKMELFNPEIKGDILFFDLDTVITGSIDKYLHLEKTTVLSDFFWPEKSIGSGLMFIKYEDKQKVWNKWIENPQFHIKQNRGDQDFLNQFFFDTADRWQDLFPGKILSYKKHFDPACRFYQSGYTIEDSDIICFHGQPRPWDLKQQWILDIIG